MSRGERVFNAIRGYAAVAMIYAAAYRMGGWDAVCIAAGAILLAISMVAGFWHKMERSTADPVARCPFHVRRYSDASGQDQIVSQGQCMRPDGHEGGCRL